MNMWDKIKDNKALNTVAGSAYWVAKKPFQLVGWMVRKPLISLALIGLTYYTFGKDFVQINNAYVGDKRRAEIAKMMGKSGKETENHSYAYHFTNHFKNKIAATKKIKKEFKELEKEVNDINQRRVHKSEVERRVKEQYERATIVADSLKKVKQQEQVKHKKSKTSGMNKTTSFIQNSFDIYGKKNEQIVHKQSATYASFKMRPNTRFFG